MVSGEPNGGDLQNCTTYDVNNGKFYDDTCSYKSCFVCSWKNNPIVTLKGLCQNSDIDQNYIVLPQHIFNGRAYFLGFGRNSIIFDKKSRSWLIIEDTVSDLLKEKKEPQKIMGSYKVEKNSIDIPIGSHLWNLTGHCNKVMTLKLTHVSKICYNFPQISWGFDIKLLFLTT